MLIRLINASRLSSTLFKFDVLIHINLTGLIVISRFNWIELDSMDVDSFRCRTGSNRIQMNWLNVDQFKRIELNQTNLVNLTAKLDVDDLIELDCDSIKPD